MLNLTEQEKQQFNYPNLPTDIEVLNSIQLFLEWNYKNQVKWIDSEVIVGSENYMYAGRFDAIALVNGLITLIDFKTSSGIHKEYSFQLSGYQNAYEEMEKMPKIAQRMVLWIPKTGNEFEGRIIHTPHTVDLNVFLSALSLYKSLKVSERALELI